MLLFIIVFLVFDVVQKWLLFMYVMCLYMFVQLGIKVSRDWCVNSRRSKCFDFRNLLSV